MAAAVPAAGEPFVKLPFSFATRFLFRLFLPGLLLALAFWPLLDKTLALMRISIDTDVLLLLAATISGWLIVVLDPHVYMLFEGRRYWPRWLWRRFHEGEQSRLARLRLKRQSASNANDKARVNELDIEEYTFPLSENGTPQAVYPTRIGNIITEYEQYPDRKYGIDGVFYWYRLWINLDSDLRTEIDEHQAVVDGMIYVSFVLYLGGILFLAYSAVQKILGVQFVNQLTASQLLLVGMLFLLTGYAIYRLSLQAYWQFGNYWKAMFDCFYAKYDPRSVLELIAKQTGEDGVKSETGPDAYHTAWRYLRWHEFRPQGAHANINFEMAKKRTRKGLSAHEARTPPGG